MLEKLLSLWGNYGQDLAFLGFKIFLVVLGIVFCVAYLTYAERKIIAAMQLRVGPNVVGIFGLLQPIADAIKLMHKETILPKYANKIIFYLSPVITFTLSLVAWAVIPADFGKVFADINLGLLYLFAVSGMAVYGIILAGWSSNSKYALLGSMRSVAQMISYEVSIGLIIVSIVICTGSLNLTKIVEYQKNVWFVIPMFPIWVIFFISSLAECNRAPFDLPEAEAELVGGYHVEYSSLTFSMFFLGEYANMILMSAMNAILFFGGWLPPMDRKLFCWIPNPMWFILKICFFLFLFIWVRATLPRYRYDQLMKLGWKIFLPITLAWVIITAIFMKFIF